MTTNKVLLYLGRILLTIIIVTFCGEFMISRASSGLLTAGGILIIGVSFYLLILQPIIKHIKS